MNKLKWPIIGLFGVATLIVVIYLIVKKSKENAESQASEKTILEELNKAKKQETATLTDLQAQAFADKIYKAVKGWGTNTTNIYEVYSNIGNYTDALLIENKFGTRDNMTLKLWIYDDLSSSEIDKLNKIIADKGINYKF